MAAVCSVTVAEAAVMHQDVSLITYTDFGQNFGRYSTGNVNSLLRYIREQNGGVQIYYPNDLHPTYTLAHDMIDYSSTIDGGFGALIGRNFFATVRHNGVWTGTVTGKTIGRDNAITYAGVEYRHSSRFVLAPSIDYKITRLSKITTDVTPSVVYGETNRDWSALYNGGLGGQLLYRAGGGYSGIAAYDGSQTVICYTYTYITGGSMVANGVGINNQEDGTFTASYTFIPASSGVTQARPLPFRTQGGDSGSPIWIWNTSTNQYEYLAAHQARGGDNSYARGASEWTLETMASYDKAVDMSAAADATAYIYAAKTLTGTTLNDDQNRTANPYYGVVTDSSGQELARYIGVKQGINTWNDLSELKDTDNWYHYGASYFNSSGSAASSTDTQYAHSDMMQTENLHFTASAANNSIVVQESADLGVGYVHLSKVDSLEQADFTITGADTCTQLNSAGYVIDDNVNLHLKLTGETDYMREWRAVVAEQGKLYIEGSGDTNVLLNLGGQGTVYLNREGGSSAYNVLANNGVTVVISDVNQIERDFTFGFRGGVLDMNGCSMTWNNDNTAASDGFTIHALDEQALITNLKAGSTTELTWTQTGTRKWLGSFIDSKEGGALRFIYDGGTDGVLTMNTIHTSLTNEGSGMTVASGKLILSGSNTVHAPGSFNGRNANRYVSADDWHYADAATDVDVRTGATFELGSHARLRGDVSVAEGATFIMREGVKHPYEYIEGGERLESTYDIAQFYGLYGDIVNNGRLNFHYSAGTTSTNLYTGNMSGSGSMEIDLGTSGAILVLSGTNTMSGGRNIISGGVVLEGAGAFGTAGATQAWQIGEKGWLAVSRAETVPLLSLIDSASSGSLALANDMANQLDMSGHQNLFLGAMKGMSVQYGAAGTMEELAAWHPAETGDGRKQWLLGGGGGEIVVNWLLRGDNDLVLGNDYMSGTVTLTNTGNDFTGSVIFSDKGNVVLNFTDARALGDARVALSYGKGMSGGDDVATWLAGSVINTDATGILLLDNDPDANISLTRHTTLHLGANGNNVKFTGNIAVNENGTYYFGGPGSLLLENALAANGTNDLVVDAEGFNGGLIQLNKAAGITGNVTVTGYDDTLAGTTGISSGSIRLWLNADDALKNAASVTVTNGGSLGIRQSTTQNITSLTISGTGAMEMAHNSTLHVANLQMEKGSRLSGPSGEVAIQVEQGTIAGAIQGKTLVKMNRDTTLAIGDGNSLAFDSVEVKEGTLALGWDMQGGSTVLLYGGGDIQFGHNAISGSLSVVENAVLTMTSEIDRQHPNYGGIKGALDIAQGATLSIKGTGFSFRGSTTHLSSGGTLDLSQLGTVQLTTGVGDAGQVFESTVILGGTTLKNTSNSEDMSLEFKHLSLKGGATLSHSGGNTNWTVHSLTGNGTLTFDVNSSHTKTSTLTFDGEGDMSGLIVAKSSSSNSDVSRRFGAVLQLSHELAAQNAEISLQGTHDARCVALALNADRIRMKGLSSTGYASTYAGAAFAEAQANAPTSARNTTLELTGDGTYDYSGGVAGSSQSAISLLKTGSGTQSFVDGKGTLEADHVAVFRDVSVLGGTLKLNNTTTTVLGDYAIGEGATLTLNNGSGTLDLASDRTLSILASGDASTSATLNGNLMLSGGTFSFSGKGMSMIAPDSYLLTLTGALTSSNVMQQNILFTDSSYIEDGKTYYLARGDFAALGWSASSFTASGVEHYDAKFDLTSQGLSVIFSSKDGNLIWRGTDDAHTWTNSLFGTREIPGDAESFVFTDAAANKNVLIGGDIRFKHAKFNSTADYTIASDSGNLSLVSLEKDGSGDLILQSGVTVTGNTVANDGRIVLYDNALQGTISGAGTVTLATNEASISGLTGTIGTLELSDGVTTTVNASLTQNLTIAKALVQAGATLQINCAFSSAVTLNGGTLSMAGGSSLSDLTVGTDSTLTVASGGSARLGNASSLNGATLNITGGGTTNVSAATKIAKINLQQGTLAVTQGNNVRGIGEITLGSGTALLLGFDTGMDGVAINMLDGSSITLQNGNATRYHILNADITLTGTATIRGSHYGNGSLVRGSISGAGTLVLAKGSGNALSYSATISDQNDQAKLALRIGQGVNVTLGGTGSYSGGTEINGATVTTDNVYALGMGVLTMTSSTLTLKKDLAIAAMSDGAGSRIFADKRSILLMGTGEGSSYSFSGALSGVSLTKAGEGSQAFTSIGDVRQIAVQGGSLSLSGSALNILDAVSVAHGATLTLGGNITLAQAINSKGTVNFEAGTVISLSETDFDDTHRYVVVTGTGTVGALNLSNFTIDGTGADDLADLGLAIEVINNGDGTASLYAMLSDLTWNGADGTVWNADPENRVWLNKRGAVDSFAKLATVRFENNGASTNVIVGDGDDVKPLKMVIGGTGFSFSGNRLSIMQGLNVAENASATFGCSVDADTITVDGTAVFQAGATATSLSISGNAEFAGDRLSITQGLNVAENASATFGCPVDAGTITVDGTAVFQTGATASSLSVSGNAEFAGDLRADAVSLTGNAVVALNGSYGKKDTSALAVVLGNTSTLKLAHSGSIKLAETSTGTLEVLEGASVNLGTIGGDITLNYHLAGNGRIEFATTTTTTTDRAGVVSLSSTGSTFNGTLAINLGTAHVLAASPDLFTADSRVNLVLTGGSSNAGFILNNSISGETNVLHIGSLASDSTTAWIRGDYAAGTNYRYLSIHQDSDTVFAGSFQKAGDDGVRSPGLMMNGTGRLKLTGNNTSTAKLIINSGTVEISGGSGVWSGNVEVNNGGRLDVQKSGAVAAGKTISLAGMGANNSGALNLANGVSVGNAVSLAADGAGIYTAADTSATLTGTVSGGTLTKLGAGSLTLSGTTSLTALTIESGTLVLNGSTTLGSTISNSGTLEFGSGVIFNLSMRDFVDRQYNIVTGDSGSTGGSLTLDNIRIDGDSAGSLGIFHLEGVGTSHVYLTYDQVRSLTWNGTADSSTWDCSDSNLNWLAGSGSGSKFSLMDNVSFTSAAGSKAVAIAGDGVRATNVTVSAEGYQFSGGKLTVIEDLTLEDGAEASFANALDVKGGLVMAENTKLTLNEGITLSSGTIVLESGRTLEIGADITPVIALRGGTLAVQNGVTFNGVNVEAASSLEVASGSATFSENFAVTDNALLTKTGAGTLVLGSKMTPGNFRVAEGALSLNSFDYQCISAIDLQEGTRLILNNQWTSIAKTGGTTAINMASSSTLEMHNGGTGTCVVADIAVDARESAAVIRGIENGNNMKFSGTISGQGTLQYRSLVDGVTSANSWEMNSAVTDGATGALRVEMDHVRLRIGGTGANTYSGGTSIADSTVTVAKESAFGAGALSMSNSSLTLQSNLSIASLSGGAGNTLTAHAKTLTLTGAEGEAVFDATLNDISLVKAGTGSQVFTNVQTLNGVAVHGGELSLSGDFVHLQGNVTVAQSATLTLSGAISLASPIHSDGTVNFRNATFALSSEDFGYSRNYSIVTGSGSITGTLTLADFTIDGTVANSASYKLVNTNTGNLYLSLIEVRQLVWNGTGDSNAWIGTNWKNRSETGEQTGVEFRNEDDVRFTAEPVQKSVYIGEDGVTANHVFVDAAGYSFSGGTLTMLGDMSLTEGAGAVFDNDVVLGEAGVEIDTVGSSAVKFNGSLSGGALTKTGTGSITLESASLANLASATLSEGETILSDRLGGEADFARVLLGTDASLSLNLVTETVGTKLVLNDAGSGTIKVHSGMLRVGAGASELGSATLQMADGTGLSFADSGEVDSTFGHDLALADGTTVMVYAEGTRNVISGSISGGGTFSKSGSGTVTLTGSLDQFTGVLSVAANNSPDNRLILETDAALSRLNFGVGSSLMVGTGHTLSLSGMTTANFYASVSHILADDTHQGVVNVTLGDNSAETSLDKAQSVHASYFLSSGLTLHSSTGAGGLTIGENGSFAVNGNVQIGTGAGLHVAGGTLSAENIILDRPSAESGLAPSFTLSSGTLNLTGTGGSISLAGGGTAYNLSLTGGTVNTSGLSALAADLTLGGVTFTGAGMSFAAGNTVTWNGHAISNNGGTLNFDGHMELGAGSFDHATKAPAYYDALDADSGNGYAVLLFARNTNGGRVNFGADSTISYNGIAYNSVVSDDDVYLQGNAGIYYVTSGTLDYGAVDNSAASAGTTGISLEKDTTVTIQENATLDLADISKNGHALTIDGNGVFINGTTGASMNAALANTWAGTVVLSGQHPSGGILFDRCGKAANGSVVRCVGLSGWINPNSTTTDINLEFARSEGADYAFHVTGTSQRTYTFNGKVTGDGSVKITSGGYGDPFVFAGDVAGWTGALDVVTKASKPSAIKFTRNGDSVINLSGISNIGAGILEVEVSGSGNKRMTGTVSGAAFTMRGSGTLVMEQAPHLKGLTVSRGGLSVAQGITLQGNATVAANAALTLGGSISLNSAIANSGRVTFLEDSVISVQSSAFADKRYDVVTGSGSILSELTLANFTIDGAAADDDGHYSLVCTGTNLYLSYSDKATLLWNGTEAGNTWSGSNWTAKAGGSARNFTELDHVRFAGNAGNKAVVVDAQGVGATDVSIESTGYSFSGGGITVHGDLRLADGASATFSNQLSLGENSALALGSGSTLSLSGSGMELGNTVTIGEGGATLDLAENTTLALHGNVSGGALNKQGAGSLTLDGEISLSALTVESGTLNLGGTVSLGSAIVNSGTLNIAEATKFRISQADFSADNTFTLVRNSGTLNGSIGLDDITIDGAAASTLDRLSLVTSDDGSRLYLTYGEALTLYWNGTEGNNNWRSGNWLNGANAPATFYNGDNVYFTGTAAEKNVLVNAEGVRANHVSIESTGYSFSGGDLEISGTMSLGAGVSVEFGNNVAAGESGITLDMADDAAITFSGNVSGGAITKTGAGTVTAGVDALSGLASFSMETGNLVLTGTAGEEADLRNLRLGSGVSLSVRLRETPAGSLLTLDHTNAANVQILSGTLRVDGESHLGSGTLQMSGGTALSFAGNSTLSKNVDVVGSGSLTLYGTGTENIIDGAISGSGALTVANGANVTVKGGISVGSVNLNSGGTLHLDLGKAVNLNVANAGQGTLSVANGTSVNLGNISGNINYRLAGDGNIAFTSSSGKVVLNSTGSTFNGTLTINLGTAHVVANFPNLFTSDSRVNLVLTGGSNTAGFILNNSISGETNVLHIGSLASDSTTAWIRGDYATGTNYRYLSVHQDSETEFAGSFQLDSGTGALRSPGLMMNGTGRLKLTGNNTSTAKLIINSGTVEISGRSGVWSGNVAVNNGGLLDVQKSGAVVTGKTISLAGMGANGSGALNLANGVSVGNAVSLAAGGAGIYTAAETAATLSGTVSGGTLTKLGGGSLTLSGTTTLDGVNVNEGTLTLSGATTLTGNVVVAEQAELTLSGEATLTDLTIQSGTLTLNGSTTLGSTISNSGTLEFGSGATINLSMEAFVNRRYDIVTGSGSTGASLTLDNILIDGVSAGSLGIFHLGGVGTGNVYLTYDQVHSLIWNGTADSTTWDCSDSNLNWLTGSGSDTKFSLMDNVSFTSAAGSKSVAIAETGVQTANMTVSAAGYEFSGGGLTVIETLMLEDGATASFAQALNVKGDLTMSQNTTLTQTGEAEIGNLTLEDGATASFAQALNVKGNLMMSGNTTLTQTGNAEIGNLTLGAGSTASFANALTVQGNLTMSENTTLTQTGEAEIGNLTLGTGSTASFAKALTLNGGLEMSENTKLTLNEGITLSAGTIVLESGRTLEIGTDIAPVIALRGGTLAVQNGVTFNGVNVEADSTLEVATGSATFSEKFAVTNNALLTKTGAGTLALTNKETPGNFRVAEGSLSLDSFDYQHISGIDLQKGSRLILNDQWTSIDKTGGTTAINMASGSTLEMHNGGSNTRVNANIVVDAQDKAAVIRGIENGNYMYFSGTISGRGTLQYRSLVDGVTSANSWAVNSAVTDGATGALRVEMDHVLLSIGGTGANTYSGGTSIADSTVTVARESAFGSGALSMSNSTLTLQSDLSIASLSSEATNTITANANTLTLTLGSVEVNGGELSLSGASVRMLGEVTVAQSATLTLGGAIDLATPILSDGTVNFSDATFALASTDFGQSRSYSIVTGTGTTRGDLTLADFTIDGAAVDDSRYKLTGMGTGNLYISLIEANQLIWNGSADGDGAWGGQSWSPNEGGTANQEFTTRDSVIFTDKEGVNKNITVAQDGVVADNITIEGAGYRFDGGTVEAAADLILTNNVDVSFNAGLTVSGDVIMGENAVLRVSGGLSAAENSPIHVTQSRTLAIDDGQLGEGTQIILDGGMLELGSSNNMSAIEIASNSHVKVADTATVSLAREGNGGLTKSGAGELELNFGTLNKDYTVQEGTLSLTQDTTTIGDNASLTVKSAGTLNGAEIQMTSGTLNVTGGTADVQGVSFRSVDDSSNPTDSRGTFNLGGNAVLTVGEGGIKGVQQSVAMNLGDGTVKAKDSDFTIGSDGNQGDLADVTLSGTTGTKFDTNGHTITVENNLTGDGALRKTGEGTLTLQGTNTYTGDTTVSQGSLALGGQGSLDNGSVRMSTAENAAGAGELRLAVVSDNSISSAAPGMRGEMNSLEVQLLELQLTIKDMVIAADTSIGKLSTEGEIVPMAVAYSNARGATEVAVENSVLKLVAGTNATVGETATLTETITGEGCSIAAGTMFTTVTCNNFSVDSLSGSLLLDFEGIWSGDIVSSGAVAVVFEGVSAFGENTVISASIPGYSISPAVTYGTVANGAVAYFSIPEPTTGALSVLALAALAARRRRR